MRKPILFFLALLFFLGQVLLAQSSAFSIRSGYYVGNGLSRSITIEVGFAPDLVIIKSDNNAGEPVWKIADMGNTTAYTALATANFINGIISLDSNGFSLGTSLIVNTTNVRYTWVAFSGSGGSDFKVGTYYGNGIDSTNQDIVGFQPDFVMIKSSGANAGCWRTSAVAGANTLFFAATNVAIDCIKTLRPTGFQVGVNASVNSNTIPYYYAAFTKNAGAMDVGFYAGNGVDNRSITGEGFMPDLVLVKQLTATTAQTAAMRSNQNYGDESHIFAGPTANAVNIIQSLEADGFQVGTDNRVNLVTATTTYEYASWHGVPAPATPTGSYKMANNTYTGNGTSQSVTGLGFAPDLVIIKSADTNFAVFSTSMMSPGSAAYFATNVANITTNGITLGSDGFTVGSSLTVNSNTIVYRWIAFGNSGCADFKVGAYTGIAADNRSIPDTVFQPDLVVAKAATGTTATQGSWRSPEMSGDLGGFFYGSAEGSNLIQALETNGFQIGTGTWVNTAGATHYYFAFKQQTGKMKVGSYAGNGAASHGITGVGFQPQLVWVKNTGASAGVLRESTLTGANSQFFLNTANAAANIISLDNDGFSVGNDARVNTNSVPVNYRYVAWRSTAATSKLGFSVQPSNTAAAASISPAVKVAVQDQFGQTITGDNSTSITMTIEVNPAGGTLTGTLTQTAVAGIATFNDLKINNAGVGYKLRASGGGYAIATSESFNITPANAAKLHFVSQPISKEAGGVIGTVTVEVLDAANNRVTGDNSTQVSMTFEVNAGGGTLSGTVTKTMASGIAIFSDLTINKAAAGYKLRATSGLLTTASSEGFNISPAAANKFSYQVNPSNTVAGVSIAPAVSVAVLDQYDNITPESGRSVTVAISSNPGGGTLSGTLAKTITGGVATFENLSINKVGSGYTLIAYGNVTSAYSGSFDILPAAANNLVFDVQPVTVEAGVAITPAVAVSIHDQFGNLVTADSRSIVMSIQNNPGSATLTGTLTKDSVSGVASFENLSLDKAGSGYTLRAGTSGLTFATSSGFDVNYSTAAKLGFSVQPSNATSEVMIAPAVKVAVQDQFGNRITADNATQITVTTEVNPTGGILSGTLTQTVVSGEATFSNLKVDTTGTGYKIGATATGLQRATSEAFNISPANASKLRFVSQPISKEAGGTIGVVTVEALDASNNRVTWDNSTQISMTFEVNAGSGVLSGTVTKTAASGIATFSDLSINKSAAGYKLRATSGALTAASSEGFDISPTTANNLLFDVQPATVEAGIAITPEVVVSIRDQFGNLVTADSRSIVMSIQTNPGSATLTGTLTKDSVSGVASFENLSLDKAGSGYILRASTSGLTFANSGGFDVGYTTPAKLGFSVQPSATTSEGIIAPAVKVAVQDQFGNRITADNATQITVTMEVNPTGGILTGTLTQTVVSGEAAFNDLTIDTAGVGYKLGASATGLQRATSEAFNISPANSARLRFVSQPISKEAGGTIGSVTVEVLDSSNNRVTGDNSTPITMTFEVNAGGGVLSGTLTKTVASGIATFTNLSINKAAADYKLRATSGALTAASSEGFDISPAAASKCGFIVHPSNATAGSAISPAVQVVVMDQFDNVTPESGRNVTVAIQNNPGGGTLSGTVTRTTSNGVATFEDLSINAAGTGYTLSASSELLTSATSNPFNITAGAADHFKVTGSAAMVAGDVQIITVTAYDLHGNVATGYTGDKSITFSGANASPNPATIPTCRNKTNTDINFGSATTVTITSGIGSSLMKLYKAETGHIQAVDGAITTASTDELDVVVTAGAKNKLLWATQPSSPVTAGAIWAAFSIEITDAYGNRRTDADVVTVTPSSGTLGGTTGQAAVTGLATFNDITRTTGGLLTLSGSSGSLIGTGASVGVTVEATSASYFKVTGGSALTAGSSETITVTAYDQFGNVATGYSGSKTLTFSGANSSINPATSPTCSDKDSLDINFGSVTVVTFTSGAGTSLMKLYKAETGHIQATDGSLTTPATCELDVVVTAGDKNKLAWVTQPSSPVTSGATWAPFTIEIADTYGNRTADIDSVTVAPSSGVFGGTAAKAAVAGLATFSAITYPTAESITVSGSSGSLTGTGASGLVTVEAASANYFIVTGGATISAGSSETITVTAYDQFGNVATGYIGDKAITFSGANASPNPATNPTCRDKTSADVNFGTATTVTFASGVGTLLMKLYKVETGHIKATDGGITTASTNELDVVVSVGVKNKLLWVTQPSSPVTAGATWDAFSIEIADAYGNRRTDAGVLMVTPSSGTLGGTTNEAAAAGLATFSDITYNSAGNITVIGTASGLTGTGTSGSVTVNPVSANYLKITGNAAMSAGDVQTVTITAYDQYGNVATGYTGDKSITFSGANASPNPATAPTCRDKASEDINFGSATTITFASGVGTSLLKLYKVETGHIQATDGSISASGTNELAAVVTAGAKNKLLWVTQPSSPVGAGEVWSPIAIEITDFYGNRTSATDSIAVSASSGSSFGGTITKPAVAGLATFSDLVYVTPESFTVAGSASDLNGTGPSGTVVVNFGAPSSIYFSSQPSTAEIYADISPPVKVGIKNQFGVIITTDNTSEVTLAIQNNPGGASLYGTTTRRVSSGEASFDDVYLTKTGAGYTLSATLPGVPIVTSEAFAVTGSMTPPSILLISPSREAINVSPDAHINIAFSHRMDRSAVENAFTLKTVKNNNGSAITIEVTGSTSWDGRSSSFTFIPSASLLRGYTYVASLAATAIDQGGLCMLSAESWTFSVIFDHSAENTIISQDGKVKVVLGVGTLPEDGSVKINRDPRAAPTAVDPTKITEAIDKVLAEGNPFHYPIASSITEFNFYDASGTRVATTFAESAIITINYDDADNDGIVDGTTPPISAKDLLLYRLDEGHGLWVRVPNCAVNLTEHYVWAPVKSFSVYAIMSTPAVNVSAAYAFPNPFKPADGHTTITFTNLASQCTIRIYTVSGELVKTINENSGTGQNIWDVKNEAGEPLASGLYIYLIKSADDTKTGKLVVIR